MNLHGPAAAQQHCCDSVVQCRSHASHYQVAPIPATASAVAVLAVCMHHPPTHPIGRSLLPPATGRLTRQFAGGRADGSADGGAMQMGAS